jgi:hypothetical protein
MPIQARLYSSNENAAQPQTSRISRSVKGKRQTPATGHFAASRMPWRKLQSAVNFAFHSFVVTDSPATDSQSIVSSLHLAVENVLAEGRQSVVHEAQVMDCEERCHYGLVSLDQVVQVSLKQTDDKSEAGALINSIWFAETGP